MQIRQTITRTVEGVTYTLDHGTLALVEARRSNARGASPRDNAMILQGLRTEVAERLGVDRRTAHAILASVTYKQLFV